MSATSARVNGNGNPKAQQSKGDAAKKPTSDELLGEICALLKGVVDKDGNATPTTPDNVLEHVRLMKGNYEKAVLERGELSRAWRQLSKTLG